VSGGKVDSVAGMLRMIQQARHEANEKRKATHVVLDQKTLVENAGDATRAARAACGRSETRGPAASEACGFDASDAAGARQYSDRNSDRVRASCRHRASGGQLACASGSRRNCQQPPRSFEP